jgi:hypothetical protein
METNQTVYDVCRDYLLDQAHTLTPELSGLLLGQVRSRSWKQLSEAVKLFDPHCHGIEVRRALSQVQAFFKKNASLGSDTIETRAAALTTFLDGESSCRRTNKRLDYYHCTNKDRCDPELSLWVVAAQHYIYDVLGSFRPFLEELPSRIRVTGGATSTRSRRRALPHLKVGLKPVATRRSEPYLQSLASFFGYSPLKVKYTSTNRVEFVPKNCKTDRTIACEPEGNVPLQLAFDEYAKLRLKKRGINLSLQSKNQELARLASIDGLMATVDIKNASGTLAFNVVALLFPQEWFDYLCDIRSPHYTLNGSAPRKYAMFSSMGNGATFAVETLVFAACCFAVQGNRNFNVYGDDIVAETASYGNLVKLLQHLGFKVNHEKSYSSGPFRESCGYDWYEGVNITPFYVREWRDRGPILCHNINGIMAISNVYGRVWDRLKALIGAQRLPHVPWSLDTMQGVHVDAFTAYKLKLIRRKDEIHYYRAFTARGAKATRVADSRTLFLWHLDKYRTLKMKQSTSERSWASLPLRKYVRAWVLWHVPKAGVPAKLSAWSDFLIRES